MWYEDIEDDYLPKTKNFKESEADRRGYEMCKDIAAAHASGDEKQAEVLSKEVLQTMRYPFLYMLEVNLRSLFGFPSTGMWSELRNSLREMGEKKVEDKDPDTDRKWAEIEASYARAKWANSLKKGQS